MADYKQVKVGRLKLKGLDETSRKKKHKKKKRERVEEESVDLDGLRHGGWRKINNFSEVSGNVALQSTVKKSYIEALNTGYFTLGELRDDGENSPAPVEVFTAVPVSGKKMALKSGFGKYISVDTMGNVSGRSEAIGPQEQFECVFEDDKVALETYNGCFLSVTEEGKLSATKKIASEWETFYMRTNVSKLKVVTDTVPENEKDLRNHEISFVKKFQSFQDRHLRLSEQETSKLKRAKGAGRLHEEMLDRREKMKADRYCK